MVLVKRLGKKLSPGLEITIWVVPASACKMTAPVALIDLPWERRTGGRAVSTCSNMSMKTGVMVFAERAENRFGQFVGQFPCQGYGVAGVAGGAVGGVAGGAIGGVVSRVHLWLNLTKLTCVPPPGFLVPVNS